jgi:hypothetical protein
MTRPAEGPGTPQREMVTLDRIRLTGLLRKKPRKRGFFYGSSSPLTSDHVPYLTAVLRAIETGRTRAATLTGRTI